MTILATLCLLFFALPAGFLLYRLRYPKGILPRTEDTETARLVRTSRRRVLPLPPREPRNRLGR
jgi:hypothetical protein